MGQADDPLSVFPDRDIGSEQAGSVVRQYILRNQAKRGQPIGISLIPYLGIKSTTNFRGKMEQGSMPHRCL